ncbi:MAG: hypothetical protein H0V00_03530 [Chloroflexia bacterium]|nr:hypothetical protein [Chloroflexia bacterium]
MEAPRLFAIIALILLPTVMYGGYALLRMLERGEGLSEFQRTYFRAGHAHAGVLLVLALVYYQYLGGTTVADGLKWLACVVLQVGILAQAGGFFVHMSAGRPGAPSLGTRLTTAGAVLLAVALLFLAYALIGAYPG